MINPHLKSKGNTSENIRYDNSNPDIVMVNPYLKLTSNTSENIRHNNSNPDVVTVNPYLTHIGDTNKTSGLNKEIRLKIQKIEKYGEDANNLKETETLIEGLSLDEENGKRK